MKRLWMSLAAVAVLNMAVLGADNKGSGKGSGSGKGQPTSGKGNPANVNHAKSNPVNVNHAKVNQVNLNQANVNQVNVNQVNLNQVNVNQVNVSQVNVSQVNAVQTLTPSVRVANYHITHGSKASFGYSYPGAVHNHWTQRCWSDTCGCYCYWDPCTSVYYYWCNPDKCWYPISYCPYGKYTW